MEPKFEPEYTPEKIAELEKSRTISDAELLKGGAEYSINEKGEKENLLATEEQKDGIHRTMSSSPEAGEAKRLWETLSWEDRLQYAQDVVAGKNPKSRIICDMIQSSFYDEVDKNPKLLDNETVSLTGLILKAMEGVTYYDRREGYKISERLLENKDFCLKAIKINEEIIEKVSEDIRDDDEFAYVFLDVAKINRNFGFISSRLRDNKDFVMDAIRKSTSNAVFISDRLRKDENILSMVGGEEKMARLTYGNVFVM